MRVTDHGKRDTGHPHAQRFNSTEREPWHTKRKPSGAGGMHARAH